MFARRHSVVEVMTALVGLALAEHCPPALSEDELKQEAERRRAECDVKERIQRSVRREYENVRAEAGRKYDAAAVPIRAERMSRKAYNYRKRPPKGHPDRIED